MKEYFEIFKNKEDLILTLGLDVKEYEKIKEQYQKAVEWLRKSSLQEKVNNFLNEVLQRAEKLKKETVLADNTSRSNGDSFEERKKNIERIEMLNDFIAEHKELLKRKISFDLVEPEDIRIIKKQGFDYFIRNYFKKLYV